MLVANSAEETATFSHVIDEKGDVSENNMLMDLSFWVQHNPQPLSLEVGGIFTATQKMTFFSNSSQDRSVFCILSTI